MATVVNLLRTGAVSAPSPEKPRNGLSISIPRPASFGGDSQRASMRLAKLVGQFTQKAAPSFPDSSFEIPRVALPDDSSPHSDSDSDLSGSLDGSNGSISDPSLGSSMSLGSNSPSPVSVLSAPSVSGFSMDFRPHPPLKTAKKRTPEEIAQIRQNFDVSKDAVRKVLLGKVDPSAPETYYKLEKDGAERDFALGSMKKFIESDEFDAFYEELTDVMSQMTESDMESLTSGRPTAMILRFIDCFIGLEKHGFFHRLQGKSCHFWSGEHGKKRANSFKSALSDSKFSAVALGLDINRAIRGLEKGQPTQPLTALFPKALCCIYALYARGDVYVHMSTDKDKEISCFQQGNVWSDAELPILRYLQKLGLVGRIWVSHRRRCGIWTPYRDLDGPRSDVMRTCRRDVYPNKAREPRLHDEHPIRFAQPFMPKADFDKWALETETRQTISQGLMRRCARKAHALIKQKIAAKKEKAIAKIAPILEKMAARQQRAALDQLAGAHA